MKKAVAWILILVFMLTMAPAAWAEPQTPISKQEAMEIAKELLGITSEYKLNRSNFNLDEMGNQTWGFNWMLRTDKGDRNIDVGIDATTGRIRNFYRYSPDSYGPRKYSIEEVRKTAEEFLKKTNPELVGETRLEPVGPWPPESKEGLEVSFRFSRIVNGFPYWDNGITVGVSTANGEVTSYWFNWDKDPVQVPDTVISPARAREIFNSKLGLELGYLRIYPEPRYDEKKSANKKMIAPEPYEIKPEVIPAYYPRIIAGSNGWVDAVTGDVIGYDGRPLTIPETVYNTPLGQSTPVTPPDQPLDMEEAIAKAKTIVDIPANYKLQYANYEENTDPRFQPVWYLNWGTRVPPYGNISVGVNSVTGEIINFDSYSGDPWANPVTEITEEQAKDAALDYVKKIFPSRLGELKFAPNTYVDPYMIRDGNRPFYDISFIRLVNGIPFVDNSITITVDGKGKIIRFYSNWEQMEFPPVGKVISLDQANEIYFNESMPEPGYIRLTKPDGSFETRLVYRQQQAYYETAVNAATGEIINRYNGGPIIISKAFADTKGHWAQKDIEFLTKEKIISRKEEKFRPNDYITRADITEMIVKALDQNPYYAKEPNFSDVPKDHPSYGYIEAAFKAGIVSGSGGKFAPDKAITREEIAAILVKAMGDKAVKGDKTDFKDSVKISAWAGEAVATAAASGILKGDAEGNFNPRAKVTRAEAAAMVARIMEKLAEK